MQSRTVLFESDAGCTVGDLKKALEGFADDDPVAIDLGKTDGKNSFHSVKGVSDNRDWGADNDICWIDVGPKT